MIWKDNIGNKIHIGDLVFLYSGSRAHTIQKVKSLSVRKDISEIETVVLEAGGTYYAEYVLSLTALGINENVIFYEFAGKKGYDTLGHKLEIGDEVLYVHAKEYLGNIGTLKSMSDKTCLLSIKKNRFNQTEYRKQYKEVISLSALKRIGE